jgi:hypothetical protein
MPKLATLLVGALMAIPAAHAQHLSADGGVQTFNYLADQYFTDVYFHFSPTNGTAAGLHQYDPQLEDYSAAATAAQQVEDARHRHRYFGAAARLFTTARGVV